MPKYTHKERPIPEPARVGIEELITTGRLPSDDNRKKATLNFIKEYTIDQGDLYTATFKQLNFKEQAQSLNADLARYLPTAIRAHVRKGKEAEPPRDPAETLEKCIKLVVRLKDELDAELKKIRPA